MLEPGNPVVYRVRKCTSRPGPRAKQIQPAKRGDFYSYVVDKFWIVERVLDGGKLLLKTRRGKMHVVNADDTNLHLAHWWERIAHRQRFPVAPS
jgi:hypothetical protein